jgi:hypothetical protein
MGEMCLNRLATDEEGRLALPIVRGSRAARSALGEDLWAGVMSIVIGHSLGASSRATLSRPRAFFPAAPSVTREAGCNSPGPLTRPPDLPRARRVRRSGQNGTPTNHSPRDLTREHGVCSSRQL